MILVIVVNILDCSLCSLHRKIFRHEYRIDNIIDGTYFVDNMTSSSGLETCTQKTFQGHESLLFQLLCFAPSDYVLHTAAVNVWLIYHQQGSGLETCTQISFAPKTIHAYIFVLLLCAGQCGEGLAQLSWGEHRREAWAQKLSTSTQTRPKN